MFGLYREISDHAPSFCTNLALRARSVQKRPRSNISLYRPRVWLIRRKYHNNVISYKFTYLAIYFSKALDYVNFRRTINIFFTFPRRKPWTKTCMSDSHHMKMLVGKTRYLSYFTNLPRDLPAPVQRDAKFRAIWKLHAIHGMQQKL